MRNIGRDSVGCGKRMRGAAAARNAGLRLSRGAFLLFFDADDELLPNALNAICSTIDSNPQASVILGGRITRRTDGREKYHPPPTRLDADPCARVADYLLHKRIGMGHGSTAMRRDLIEQRGYPENLKGSEDIPVFAHLLPGAPSQSPTIPSCSSTSIVTVCAISSRLR
ncbi:MAG: glycosyltransferase [Rhodocyclaceae bacterium]|nr:glycosyltransferase [Rhodocyclaceae bacterium]